MLSDSFKVIGAGSPILDILISVNDDFIENFAGGGKGGSVMLPSKDFDAILAASPSTQKISPGGSAANTIFALTRLGVKTEFLGAVGDDENGKLYRERYEKMGGCSSKIRVKNGTPTGRCLCLISPDSERTMRTDLGAAISLKADEISDCDFRNLSHLHMEGYLLFNKELAIKILDSAKNCGLRVSLDLSSFEVVKAFPDLKSILKKYVDIVFANEEEAAQFSKGKKPEDALAELADLCEIAAVKLGNEGALIKRGDEVCKVEAKKVNAIDTTGAGDLWAAGFLYGLFTEKSLSQAATFGSILGAEVVQIFGADIPESTWTSIKKEMSQIS